MPLVDNEGYSKLQKNNTPAKPIVTVTLIATAMATAMATDIAFDSLTAKSILAGKTCSYVLNFFVGIVHYIFCETKTQRAKIYLPTQRTNRQILTSTKKI
jgi:hypothetical protein